MFELLQLLQIYVTSMDLTEIRDVPKLTFQGETAVGNLETENIVVKGGNSTGGRVVTEIIPQESR